jgi:hypothetical protein
MPTIAFGFYIESFTYLSLFTIIFVLAIVQTFVFFKRSPNGKLGTNQLAGVLPVLIGSFLSIIISIDIRTVFGLYSPMFLAVFGFFLVQVIVLEVMIVVKRVCAIRVSLESQGEREFSWKSIFVEQGIFFVISALGYFLPPALNRQEFFSLTFIGFSSIALWAFVKIYRLTRFVESMLNRPSASVKDSKRKEVYKKLVREGKIILFIIAILFLIEFSSAVAFAFLFQVPWDSNNSVKDVSVYSINFSVMIQLLIDFLVCCIFMITWMLVPDRENVIWVLLFGHACFKRIDNLRMSSDLSAPKIPSGNRSAEDVDVNRSNSIGQIQRELNSSGKPSINIQGI